MKRCFLNDFGSQLVLIAPHAPDRQPNSAGVPSSEIGVPRPYRGFAKRTYPDGLCFLRRKLRTAPSCCNVTARERRSYFSHREKPNTCGRQRQVEVCCSSDLDSSQRVRRRTCDTQNKAQLPADSPVLKLRSVYAIPRYRMTVTLKTSR